MKWLEHYKLGAAETDINNIASASSVMRYLQDCANCHLAVVRPSYDELFKRGFSFVLSRMSVVFREEIRAHDSFDCETWASGSKGVTFNRCYRIIKNGITIVEASSAWALLDIKNGRPCRVSDSGIDYRDEEPLELDMPTRFRIPNSPELSNIGERFVEYADCDINGHMNNTKYYDILCGYTGSMVGRRLERININFINEAHLGEKLTVYHSEQSDTHYLRTLREDGRTNVEAELRFKDIVK